MIIHNLDVSEVCLAFQKCFVLQVVAAHTNEMYIALKAQQTHICLTVIDCNIHVTPVHP